MTGLSRLLCDGCFVVLTGGIPECADGCGRPLDHVGICAPCAPRPIEPTKCERCGRTDRLRPVPLSLTQAMADARAVDAIAHLLRDPEWGVGMLEDIAA